MQTQSILIATADSSLLYMLSHRLKNHGLRVYRSTDALHALTSIHRDCPDLVLLDVNITGGNGLSVCEMLAGNPALSRLPVIVMSSDASEGVLRRCEDLGAQFVAKGDGLWERLELTIDEQLEFIESDEQTNGPPSQFLEGPEDDTESTPNRGVKILCIDDDPEVSKILQLRLEPYGVDVVGAFSGMQGYWTAINEQPDLIITDLRMPDGEGNYIFGRLKWHPLTEKTPIFVLSGESSPAVKRQILSLGVDAYLTKPLVFEELLEHIRLRFHLEDPQSYSEPNGVREPLEC